MHNTALPGPHPCPTWCDPNACRPDPDTTMHRVVLGTMRLADSGSRDDTVEIQQTVSDQRTDPPVLVLAGIGFTAKELDQYWEGIARARRLMAALG